MTPNFEYFISRNYTNKSFDGNPSLDQKILIFEDRIRGWQLDAAKEIRDKLITSEGEFETYQFALLALLFSYFEMIGQYINGVLSDLQSKKVFVRGLQSVFSQFDHAAGSLIYKRIRCGMYHAGIIQHGALLSTRFDEPIRIEQTPDLVFVNPVKLIDALAENFSGYITRLKDAQNKTLRANFHKVFDQIRKVPI